MNAIAFGNPLGREVGYGEIGHNTRFGAARHNLLLRHERSYVIANLLSEWNLAGISWISTGKRR